MLALEDEPQAADPQAYTLSTSDIARRFRKSTLTVWRWITKGVRKNSAIVRLHGLQVGGQYRVRPVDLDAFLKVLNPDTWQAAAEDDERERQVGRRDAEKLRQKLR